MKSRIIWQHIIIVGGCLLQFVAEASDERGINRSVGFPLSFILLPAADDRMDIFSSRTNEQTVILYNADHLVFEGRSQERHCFFIP